MGTGTVILMSLAIFCLAVSLALVARFAYLTNLRWMRLFSERLGTPSQSMEDKPIVPEMKMPVETPKKSRFSVPIPLGGMNRKVD